MICLNLTFLIPETFISLPIASRITSETIKSCAIPGRVGSPGKWPENQGESGGALASARNAPESDGLMSDNEYPLMSEYLWGGLP